MKKVLVLVAVLALAFVGCSKNSDNSTVASPTPTTANAKPTPAAAAGATVKVANNSSKGAILTNAAGMSLYTFDNDTTPNKSSCSGGCASTWPALTFSGTGTPTGTTGLTTFARDDGTKQVALNGKPLYTYSGDTKAGDTNGDGFAGKWHLAKAAA